ncbi:hypothetical protein SLS56_003781 [Neofusicoccum ribis]|uniref:Adhesin domain-containing protein n=1 Tax=Neofusicoccum ribis TaxID=45134 RepID=A0ABR3SZ55_9PEZI
MRETRSPDQSAETTPLLQSPLPPPAYPTVMAVDKDDAAGPSVGQSVYEGYGPSKDLEHADSAQAHAPGYCQYRHDQTSEYHFEDLAEFSIIEEIEQHHNNHRYISGGIVIVPAPEEQGTKISTKVTISNKFPEHDVTTDKTDTGLVVHSIKPDRYSWDERACTWIDITVSVPKGTKLDALNIRSKYLSVEIQPGVDLAVDSLRVELVSGSIDSHTVIPSRRTYISPAYGSVLGSYSLLDLLDIETAAGSVNIEVVPGEADPDKPLPAVFKVHSAAGSIQARFPTEDESLLHDRDYRVYVQTEAGSISGNYVHGYKSSFESKQGSITVKLLPFRPEEPSFIRTKNEVGPSMLDLLSPLDSAEATQIANINSEFTSSAGSVRAVFPPEWEGVADVDTLVGSLRVDGKGLSVVEEGTHGPVGRWVKAVKGHGDSTVVVKSKVGSVEFLVQKEEW